MKIKAKVRPSKIEYSRKRNKCPCCTRLDDREELIRRIECREAEQEFNVGFDVADSIWYCDYHWGVRISGPNQTT